MCVFFFKQKTAYEMRISDWSSDVCSSDLCVQPVGRVFDHRLQPPLKRRQRAGQFLQRGRRIARRRDKACVQLRYLRLYAIARVLRAGAGKRGAPHPGQQPDRKSVVTGKSVAVRVDLGGCRILKKKKSKTHSLITSSTTA